MKSLLFFHFQGLFMGNMKRKIGGRQFVLAGFSFGDRVLLSKFTSLSMGHMNTQTLSQSLYQKKISQALPA
jgi:hypothetical protein